MWRRQHQRRWRADHNAGTGTFADTVAQSDTDTDTDTDTHAYACADTNANSGANTDAYAHANTDARSRCECRSRRHAAEPELRQYVLARTGKLSLREQVRRPIRRGFRIHRVQQQLPCHKRLGQPDLPAVVTQFRAQQC
ncbi:hypothetical protein GCM10023208_12080 [Erythrobacter westpacificensis]|uniref:Uncharacterized protein n=1 Tax=Erythrobacter westpacificensis TaxID=1055231 RepID=A0ABP9K5H6_9SPHN